MNFITIQLQKSMFELTYWVSVLLFLNKWSRAQAHKYQYLFSKFFTYKRTCVVYETHVENTCNVRLQYG